MREYLLFIDTETSDLPKDWNAPYSQEGNWPFIVQVAWLVYTYDGKLIKSENHYIRDTDYNITERSHNIHKIGTDFLNEKGEERRAVMEVLRQDLLKYNPLVVGHFMQLDYHMIGVGFHRAGLENPLPQLDTFCTMLLTAGFLRLAPSRGLKLGELYERLFHKRMKNQHDALTDAKITAECFFELRKLGDINEEVISQQPQPRLKTRQSQKEQNGNRLGCSLPLLIFLFLLLIIFL